MERIRWEQAQSLFHQAVELPPEERDAFLRGACEGDDALLDEVRAMLAHDAVPAPLLDDDVARAADRVMGGAPSPVMPERFGPYRAVRLLGEGGMGLVYLAERDDLGIVAAIKVLRDGWLSPARRQRFLVEQRILAQLNHPSIARLYDADALADGTPWFAMEYVEGVPLAGYCRSNGLSLPERLRLFGSVCEAVQFAHRHMIVHRDLKPSNILVSSGGQVKLLDFGISKQLDPADAATPSTVTVVRLMTPSYAAPEQIRGEPTDAQTDVYALGVILYELLTDRLPFDLADRTASEAERILLESQPERPSAAALRAGSRRDRADRRAWRDLDALCLTAMHRDRGRRYGSVEALLRDLTHFLRHEPLDARADGAAYRAGKFVRRHRMPLAAAAVLVLAVAGMGAFHTVRLTEARNAAVFEAARTARVQRFMLSLFEGDDEAAGPPEDLRVLTMIDRGTKQAGALDADPLIQAELYHTLGSLYQRLGRLDEAERLLRSALERRRALLDADHPDVAGSLVALGELHDVRASHDEAERLIRDALDRARRRLGDDHPAVGRATAALGRVLENRGAYDRAIPLLEEAARIHSLPGGNEADLAEALTELANTRFYLGDYEASEVLNLRVIAIERRVYGDRHPHVASTLINLGAIQYQRGRYPEAERLNREALDIFRGWHGADHPETASGLTILARSIIPQNERYDEAADLLQRALAIQERVYGAVHPRVASALNELGNVRLRQRQLDEADAAFTRAGAIYRSVYRDGHYYVGIPLANLGGVHHERGDYARAERFYRDALAVYARTLPPDHQQVGITRVRLGRTLLAARRYAEAETETSAGYKILTREASRPARWTAMAREDLAAIYAALNDTEKAARLQAELEAEVSR